jgi:hypothetical protein
LVVDWVADLEEDLVVDLEEDSEVDSEVDLVVVDTEAFHSFESLMKDTGSLHTFLVGLLSMGQLGTLLFHRIRYTFRVSRSTPDSSRGTVVYYNFERMNLDTGSLHTLQAEL